MGDGTGRRGCGNSMPGWDICPTGTRSSSRATTTGSLSGCRLTSSASSYPTQPVRGLLFGGRRGESKDGRRGRVGMGRCCPLVAGAHRHCAGASPCTLLLGLFFRSLFKSSQTPPTHRTLKLPPSSSRRDGHARGQRPGDQLLRVSHIVPGPLGQHRLPEACRDAGDA